MFILYTVYIYTQFYRIRGPRSLPKTWSEPPHLNDSHDAKHPHDAHDTDQIRGSDASFTVTCLNHQENVEDHFNHRGANDGEIQVVPKYPEFFGRRKLEKDPISSKALSKQPCFTFWNIGDNTVGTNILGRPDTTYDWATIRSKAAMARIFIGTIDCSVPNRCHVGLSEEHPKIHESLVIWPIKIALNFLVTYPLVN